MYPELKITANEFLSSNFNIVGIDIKKFTAPELLRRKNPEILPDFPQTWLIPNHPKAILEFHMQFDENTSEYEFGVIRDAMSVAMMPDKDSLLYTDYTKKEIQYKCRLTTREELELI